MKSLLKTSLLLLLASILFVNCTGKDGAPGPQGPSGITGPSGPNAKKYSYSITFGPSLAVRQAYTGIPIPGPNDAIFTYIKYGVNGLGDPTYSLMPITIDPINCIAETDALGNVYISIIKSDGTNGSPLVSNNTFGFYSIVIKGESGFKKANIDYSNYEEVKAYYNIED